MVNEKLKVLDLFSGVGGFSLGLERTGGFETVAFCEIDPFCRKVLAKHWPNVPIHEDVRKLSRCAPSLYPAVWSSGQWEDGVSRVATGVTRRVDRLKSLGNAVVPQIPESIGRAILNAHD